MSDAQGQMGPSGEAGLQYGGTRGPLLALALRTGVLTLLTLGIYRFWQKTRIRKYIWSSIALEGDALEYTGTGVEKFLGFLVALVFLAVYLGALQMGLFFFGISIMRDPTTPTEALLQLAGVYGSFLAVLPFILFAIYRAQRYRAARTRWRGIRFGMEKGAWGYVARAMGHGLLSLFSLGLLLPRQTFYLEKYKAERSWYGDMRFAQTGKWTGLYRYMKHMILPVVLLFLVSGAVAWIGLAQPPQPGRMPAGTGVASVLGIVFFIWFFIGLLHYRVQSLGYLTCHKRLGHPSQGEGVGFRLTPRTLSVLKHYILGGVIIAILASVVIGAVAAVLAPFAGADAVARNPVLPILVSALGYVFLFVVMQALSLAFVAQPVLAHYVSHLSLTNSAALAGAQQRDADTGADAEGFADALDVGGAF